MENETTPPVILPTPADAAAAGDRKKVDGVTLGCVGVSAGCVALAAAAVFVAIAVAVVALLAYAAWVILTNPYGVTF